MRQNRCALLGSLVLMLLTAAVAQQATKHVLTSDEVKKATDRYWSTMERHKLYVSEHGEDMPEVATWRWPSRQS